MAQNNKTAPDNWDMFSNKPTNTNFLSFHMIAGGRISQSLLVVPLYQNTCEN